MINIIKRSGFYIIAFLLIFSCEEEPECNPLLDPSCATTIAPLASIIDDDVDSSSVTVSWEGNESVQSFSYRVESLSYDDPINIYQEWSDWSHDNTFTSVTLEFLDEGDYVFYLKGRLDPETEQEVPAEWDFTINAITDAGLRIYPLRQQVALADTADIFLYAENITDYLGAEIELQFSSNILEYSSSEPACGTDNGLLCPDASSGDNIIIWKWNQAGTLDSTQPIYQLRFKPQTLGTADISIKSAIVRNSDNVPIVIGTLQNAQIEVLSP